MSHKFCTVLSSDNVKYTLPKKYYIQSILLTDLIEEVEIPEEGISVLVESDVLNKIVEYMAEYKHAPVNINNIVLTEYDEVFLNIERTLLFKITAAANYLNMPVLLEVCCKYISTILQEKSTQEIRQYLEVEENINNEVSVEKEYKWME
ncbi:S-phase kinase-associated protein 1 [Nematocida parisii]|uniref:E3 ubiquitin ligase complex SCF subunit n=1 Tax=Nematocida parisii (strain ERTm3) TaxID=935791 RepID=I3EFQ5_NEMP3|nr:uncharacterized protein NEPG_01454 [Nematocida parisii ERTm1]EIJ88052.1 hypothetical protein NEQG_01496 [Nematocida parisii ERTm3]KAI5128448.1 S-phase kinase-associated protein 1 [Nematocida parisii]EIJ93882.1 hypothetical protein NEPG_01454 [Nematocida parisii ERTm1]KAI5128465.1 S-phase kinase-associated protein 1 [Nematocida parisii]KAI5144511.1 S-phase kinase-associated protein 1 [Nematocida parisii]|eukprot:XP_013059282.1 hypothetical protein NEPG_01454 [Nematocida parisii ERTm1]